jgi:hypothetical protein
MKIYTSYFYQIRNFTPNFIPVSTCLSDPAWYRPPENKEYYIDKRGIVCGLRYEPLIVQRYCTKSCIGERSICPFAIGDYNCELMPEYEQLLYYSVDKEKTLKAFEHCLNKFNADTIVLMVYEAPNNPCSERAALQKFFNCEELKYPICGM